MSTPPATQVRVTRRFASPPERVFDAWLDPQRARTFLFSTPAGEIVRAEIDPRVGGTFRIVDRRQGKDVEHVGTYLELERPRRIAFEYSADHSDRSRVSLDVVPSGSGSGVTLIHELHPKWADFAERAHAAWTMMLEKLAATLGEGAPGAGGSPSRAA
ncbi:MAG: SRPBCC domain-containing protein [Candidatus Eisenbacteria bacterium]|uniref:SRPBCC domain-containing protein n=1 Tax=Eiseniibacteriota bacterium TaxID=2212470 RepID=A0A538SBP4_UNCEI|nr:MAG: SRPBCC domain-containing protein [Candidatus Eisenbacteria bacterium]